MSARKSTKSEKRAKVTLVASLDAEQRSSLVWALAQKKIAQGEGLKETLFWAVRNGAELPNDPEFRMWLADGLEGKLDPERGRGRPRKRQRWDMVRDAIEAGIREAYRKWFAAFQRDRELAWLRHEALRLRQEQPDAGVWRRMFDLGTAEGRQSYETALTDLGACPCPAALKGEPTARELAHQATAMEYSQRWESVAGKRLTPSVIARIVSARAKKSE